MYQYHASYLSSLIITLALLSTSMSESDDPILRLDTCSESDVRFICAVNWTEMQWKLDFSRHPDIMARYFSDDMIGSRRVVVTNRATSYTFNLTSTSPLTSTMTANVSRDLDGATVICQDGFTHAALEDKLSLQGPQKPYHVSIANVEPEISALSASLEWNGYSNTIGNLEYFITIWPSLLDQGVSSFNTTETSLLLNLSYDQEYHMRMIASNCIGNSTPINISIGQCSIPPGANTSFNIEYSRSIIGDQVSFTCHFRLLGPACRNYVNTSAADLTSIVCSNGTLNEGGHGDDNVTVYVATKVTVNVVSGTIDPLVPSMIASHLFLSAFSCIVGIFIGFLVYRCYVSKRAQQITTSPPEPVYTEITLSANEAYGKLNP